MVVDDLCCLYLCRFVGLRGVSATPTPRISWHKTTSARFLLLCHLLICTKSNKHMLTPAYAFVNAEKVYLCRSPCEHYGSRSRGACGMSWRCSHSSIRRVGYGLFFFLPTGDTRQKKYQVVYIVYTFVSKQTSKHCLPFDVMILLSLSSLTTAVFI